MCGLVGLLGLPQPRLGEVLATMSRAVAHRGPDAAGGWVDPDIPVGMAHRRLAIIDLSPAGSQPMISGDGRWVLVFNGELYDHQDHRAALIAAGVPLRSHSDTEVLLELVAAHGCRAALESVNGMFALALWDRAERVLTLARDRMGEKPLYYGVVGTTFAFASELRAFDALPGFPTGVDAAALAEFLRLGFVPGPLSIIPGVRKLPPGTLVRVGRDRTVTDPEPYWSLDEVARRGLAARLDPDPSTLAGDLDDLLRDAVRRRLVADVPLGAFLSGGLDSTLVVALASAVSPAPVRTFTVSVGGRSDEAAHASAVAAHLGTDHTTVDLPALVPLDLARSAARLHDEPFADPSAIPTSLLCAAARDHLTVCLSGDGADELLAGYNRYRSAYGPVGRLQRLPGPARALASRAVTAVPVTTWDRVGRALRASTPDVGTKAHKLGAALAAGRDPLQAQRALASLWDPAQLLVDAPAPAPAPIRTALPHPAEALDAMLLADQGGLLPDDMLVKVDRASMAVALEVRVPFLDHRVVEHTWRLPTEAKVRGGQGKWLERALVERYVPRALWERPKTGFDPPLATWLRGPLREWATDLLSPARLRRQGLIHPEPVTTALADHLAGRRNRDYALWTVLMLQSWLDER